MPILLSFLLIVFANAAQAEPCPTYNEMMPTHVVDVGEFKFFRYPPSSNEFQHDIILIEQAGELVDLQKAALWNDDMTDNLFIYNHNIDITCSPKLDFISARYETPRGRVLDYLEGDCREVGHASHPLVCDGAR